MNYRIKNLVKSALALNTYGNAKFYRFLGAENRQRLQKRIAEMKTLDFLESVEPLREFRRKITQGAEVFSTRDANWSNGHIYGIWQAVFGEYCEEDALALPAVEHGLIFHEEVFTDLRGTGRQVLATFGDFRKEIIQKKLHRPVFGLGPYIHYCPGFYGEERQRELKKEMGKTLLVFPTHSTDTSELSVAQQDYIDRLRLLAVGYDTVLVNTFWWNIDDPLIHELEKEGYRIISCGFRDDPMFLRRLKSYILLADLAVGDSIGTHVGYCLDCGVPFTYRPVGTKVKLLQQEERKDEGFRLHHLGKLEEAFLNAEEITPRQRELCDYYWGTRQIKSAEEILLIKEISREILKKTKGFTFLSYRAAKRLLKDYEKEDIRKYRLLKDAL